jgi:hypothetical protein
MSAGGDDDTLPGRLRPRRIFLAPHKTPDLSAANRIAASEAFSSASGAVRLAELGAFVHLLG